MKLENLDDKMYALFMGTLIVWVWVLLLSFPVILYMAITSGSCP